MTRIDAAAALNSLLKSRTKVEEGGFGAMNGGRGVKRPDDGMARGKTEKSADPHFEPQMLERIRAISRDDPQRRRKTFRLFIETVLLNQLGRSLLGEPELSQLVDTVVQQIEDDEGLRASSLLAADILIERSAALK